ncbi:CDP-alcohol phosphatidyltransferase family protein [Kamptonema animale CS-326]|jgi:phosphatidylglycerophosphate synthase|uniref:CDP-alcohol phosphatidyltransferase family protein n=1 Tax=Kamptonema animale TaxID=92934 RepID=UPI00232EEA08|nr:CDP-alcohol phosphatidyltransferase family protein [Kamptonema animale]MDB9513122.1 CDP-alcohol phosphatidyltransferase family protein [Kamptonema animale CS-326]
MMPKYIPLALVIFRAAIAPFLLWDAIDGKTSIWFIIGYVAGFLSDIFDGVIARRIGASDAQLRQADSWADVCFYICVFASAWLTHRQIVIAFQWPLLAVVFAQLLWWAVNLLKYGKPASYHTYSAKIWGITLFIATIAIFGFDYAGIPLWLTIISALIHTVEEIAMTLLLPEWKHDVLSIFHALRLRRELISPQPNPEN